MGKNREMLKCYKKVLNNDREEINKVIPDMYCKSFYDIDFNILKLKGIDKLIIDIDGTILPVDSIKVPETLKEKFNEIKRNDIEVCLVSNNDSKRVIPVIKELELDKYLYEAKKPLPESFDKALKVLNTIDKDKVAMIGDQMLSDIKGAKEYGLFTILVNPVSKKQNIKTATSKFLQNRMEKHLKKQNLFDKDIYYNVYKR